MSDPNATAAASTASPADVGPILRVEDLKVSFKSEEGEVRAVDGVSFEMSKGETLAIVGESGSGKSVTSLAVMSLLPLKTKITGKVLFEGVDLVGADEKTLQNLRGNRISMIFQDPLTALNPVLTIERQISETLLKHKMVTKSKAPERVAELLDLVGISDVKQRMKQYAHEFSGGMCQRVMIAMAMACEPDLLIADEPTTALDVTVQAQVLDLLDHLQERTGMALLLISHDLGVVAGRADRVNVMYAGRVVETGSIDTVFEAPAMPYSIGLLASNTRLDAPLEERLVPIPGSPPSPSARPSGCAFHPRCTYAKDRCKVDDPVLRPAPQSGQATDPDGGLLAHLGACHYMEEVASGSVEGHEPEEQV